MKGLVIKSPYIEDILDGIKKVEIRGSNTKVRGRIILLKSGSGLALGTVEIISSEEWTLEQYNNWNYRKDNNKLPVTHLPYNKTYAWHLANPIKFEVPIPYKHPSGAIVWVNLPDFF